ncbi:MAG TPA: hypothetical protein VLD67_20275 [Vicinamibacterales bacterium]|nr:hypothetical protein [Vicinamibacterales bacterium]
MARPAYSHTFDGGLSPAGLAFDSLDGQHLLNDQKAATPDVAVASPVFGTSESLPGPGEETPDHRRAEAHVFVTLDLRVETPEGPVLIQQNRDALNDQRRIP